METEAGGPNPETTMAAELALGLLDGAERATALRRLLAEPDFALEVESWRERLVPLLADVAEVKAPDRLWSQIDSVLGPVGASGAIVTRLNRWRAMALVSTGIAASLGAFMIFGPGREPVALPPTLVMVAQIAAEDAGPVLLASYDSSSHRFRMAPAAMPTGGQTPELWLIPSDGTPRSLGVFDPSRQTEMQMPAKMIALISADATLAISLEPAGGSPTGLPTGPVVASGKMQPI